MESKYILFSLVPTIISLLSSMPLSLNPLQYSCPEVGLDFNGNDIGELNDISNWEECGMLATSESKYPLYNVWKDRSKTGYNLASLCVKSN